MFRSTRTFASLIHHLMLGTAAVAATASVSAVLVGCKDDSQPDYWVEKLDEQAWRPRAVKRLEQFYEDSVTKANKNASDPDVAALLNKIVEPLTKSYVEHADDYDSKTRVALIKLIAGFRDKRTEPALKKAFEDFVKHPKTNKDDADIKWASRAAEDLKLPGLADSMVQTFTKLKASTMLGGVTYKDLNDAMLAMPQQSWTGPLRATLDAEIVQPKGNDKGAVEAFKDQLFWQNTAAMLLGELRDTASVEALTKVLLDPAKADVQATALLALVKIGKPATALALKVLKGEDEKLVAFHARRVKETSGQAPAADDHPEQRVAALILGTLGRPEALGPMIELLKTSKSEVNKAILARELAKIPATPESKAAFQAAFESISLDTNIPPGQNALQTLAESAGQLYDPSMIDWLLQRAEKTAGAGDDKTALQSAILVTVLKLCKPEQLEIVKAAVTKYGTALEKDILALVEKQLKGCGDRVACYLAELDKNENQDQNKQFAAFKAGYMLGILGNDSTRNELADHVIPIENAAIRYNVAQAIDHLSPKGAKDTAAKLRKIITTNEKSGDKNKMAGDAPLRQVMYRIESRAE